MKKRYVVRKMENSNGIISYASADVYLEDEDGWTFICDCGEWDNDEAKKYAKAISDFLNASLILSRE